MTLAHKRIIIYEEYKVNAVKLAEKIGAKKAADELGIPDNTLYGWVRAAKLGQLNIGTGYRIPEDNLNLAEENAQLRKQLKEQEKEIKRLNELYGARRFEMGIL